MNKETKYKDTKVSFPLIFFYIIFSVGLIFGIFKVYTMPITKTGLFQSVAIKGMVLFVLIFLLCFTISGIIGSIIGSLKGKVFINKENRLIKKTNPYIYFRELPNNYGIGVTSLLFDSKIENYKDIIAVILDLCAKKYISLIKENDKYYIKILKNEDEHLLSNEKYILNLIRSHNIKNVNYKEWYNYCLRDGTNLGLYSHYENPKEEIKDGLVTKKETNRLKKIHRNISLFIGFIVLVMALITNRWLEGIFYSFITFGIVYVVLIIPFYIIFVFTGVSNVGKIQKKITYEITLNNHLKRTNKGIRELQKLISFQNFLSDFGNFVDKHPEEVVLWDRYLSYAQVFGLTKEIMSSGYKQLVENSSFTIDNIENINLYNIEVI